MPRSCHINFALGILIRTEWYTVVSKLNWILSIRLVYLKLRPDIPGEFFDINILHFPNLSTFAHNNALLVCYRGNGWGGSGIKMSVFFTNFDIA